MTTPNSVTKEQAQKVKDKLQTQYGDFVSFGLGKDGNDWTVEARVENFSTFTMPKPLSLVDGVKVNWQATGKIQAL